MKICYCSARENHEYTHGIVIALRVFETFCHRNPLVPYSFIMNCQVDQSEDDSILNCRIRTSSYGARERESIIPSPPILSLSPCAPPCLLPTTLITSFKLRPYQVCFHDQNIFCSKPSFAEHDTRNSITETRRRALKSKNAHGDPIRLQSKILAIIADPVHAGAIYIAESTATARRVVLEVGAQRMSERE